MPIQEPTDVAQDKKRELALIAVDEEALNAIKETAHKLLLATSYSMHGEIDMSALIIRALEDWLWSNDVIPSFRVCLK